MTLLTKPIGCRDSCGARVQPDEAEKEGWQFLAASRLWRCPACHAGLQKINEGAWFAEKWHGIEAAAKETP